MTTDESNASLSLTGAAPCLRDTEAALNAAVDRIISGKPTDAALLHLAQNGRLRLSISNVAREARCSRTLIGFSDCAYPAVRARVLGQQSAGRSGTLSEEVRRLKDEVKVLEDEIAVRDTAYAELLIRVSAFHEGRHPSGHPVEPQSLAERRAKLQIVGKVGGRSRLKTSG